MKKTIILLAIVGLLMGMATVMASTASAQEIKLVGNELTVTGKVVSVDMEKAILTLEGQDSKQVMMKAASITSMDKDGKKVELPSLVPGDEVTVSYTLGTPDEQKAMKEGTVGTVKEEAAEKMEAVEGGAAEESAESAEEEANEEAEVK
jgi:hypothetical protein